MPNPRVGAWQSCFFGLRYDARNAPSCFKSSPETRKPQKAGSDDTNIQQCEDLLWGMVAELFCINCNCWSITARSIVLTLFSVQRLLAFARSFNTSSCMLHRTFFFDRRPVPFGGSRCIETYSSTTSRSRPRTRGESIRG